MMIDFFGTLPGLLSLAGAAAVLILASIVKRLVARGRARRAEGSAGIAGSRPASPDSAVLPRWAVAAVAAWMVAVEEHAPSAEAWKPSASGMDPWLAAGWRNVGVTK